MFARFCRFVVPFLVATSVVHALQDLPIYLDGGCDQAGLSQSYAAGPSDMKLPAGQYGGFVVPVDCKSALSGTDAISIALGRALKSGEYWDILPKFADGKPWAVKGYVDVRFFVKNRAATSAKLRVSLKKADNSDGTVKELSVPASQSWTEIVWSVSSMGVDPAADQVLGMHFAQSTSQTGALDLLVDSIRFTDGTGGGAMTPDAPAGGEIPAGWPNTFLVGSFDPSHPGYVQDSRVLTGVVDYRYQYLMKETWSYDKSFYPDFGYSFAKECDSLKLGTSITWYYLGKAGEANVGNTLKDASFMTPYFDDWAKLLDGLARAKAKAPIIVLEPDMYGLLMLHGDVKHMDASSVPVNMTHANELAAKWGHGAFEGNLAGWAKFMIWSAHTKVPGTVIGHMINHWGVYIAGDVGRGRVDAHVLSGIAQGGFLNTMGDSGKGDVVFVEKADYDAGTKSPGNWFWGPTEYGKYFVWVKTLSRAAGLRVGGWQVSEGNMNHPEPKDRDDAVQYFLDHPQQWVDAGFVGILFGPGNFGAAWYNDNGFFLNAMKAYQKNSLTLNSSTGVAVGPVRTSGRLEAHPLADGKIRLSGWEGIAQVRIAGLAGRILWAGPLRAGEMVQVAAKGAVVVQAAASGRNLSERFLLAR